MKSFITVLTFLLLTIPTFCLAEVAKIETIILTKHGIQSSHLSATIELMEDTGEIIRSQVKRSANLGRSSCLIGVSGKYAQLEYSSKVYDLIKKEMCFSNQEMVFSHYCEYDTGHIRVNDSAVTFRANPQSLKVNLTDGKSIFINCNL